MDLFKRLVTAVWQTPAWLWKELNYPISGIRRNEPAALSVFILSAVVFGQIGTLASLLMAANSSQGLFLMHLKQNLDSANFYIFAVSLLVSTCTIIALEYLDKEGHGEIRLRSRKLIWCFVVLVLVTLQSVFIGQLASESMQKMAISSTPGPAWDARDYTQLGFWLASMLIAVVIYCLTRLHRYDDYMALLEQRRRVAQAGQDAAAATTTSDGEAL